MPKRTSTQPRFNTGASTGEMPENNKIFFAPAAGDENLLGVKPTFSQRIISKGLSNLGECSTPGPPWICHDVTKMEKFTLHTERLYTILASILANPSPKFRVFQSTSRSGL